MTTHRVSVGRLKARLSEYLRRVKAGEEIVVTDRGKPVARLVGLEGERALEGRVEELVRSGLARPPLRPLDPGLLQKVRPRDPDVCSLNAALEERSEGW
jgi:prevent-host-death family protein